jgi:quercetin dioxygenase-like cupin family protein
MSPSESQSERMKLRGNICNLKSISCLAVLMGLLIYLTKAAEGRGSGVIHIDHTKVAEAFAKGVPILATNNFKINAGRREVAGEVEIHDHDTDLFHVLEGSATFVTGGKAIEPKTFGPGETRAVRIEGGEERTLKKGDIIVIPARVPHWFKEVHGPFLYHVVKVSDQGR